MKLKGTVAGIVYVNSENGYTVLEMVTAEKSEITAVGVLPAISAGETLELDGEFTDHPKFGRQFAIKTYRITAPETEEGIVRYLSSGLIKGIGAVTAQQIVKKFGKKTISVIENDPSKLLEVRGISTSKALNISQAVAGLKKMQSQIMFLQSYEITVNLAVKIYNVYKDKTQETVSANPYKLIDDVDGVGFITADRIASSLGIEFDSKFRIRAGIVYVLKESGEKSGNTFLFMDELAEKVQRLLGIDVQKLAGSFNEILDDLQMETAVILTEADGRKCVALAKYYVTEKSIAARLIRLKNEVYPLKDDFEFLIKEFQRVNKLTFHAGQKAAILSAVKSGVTVITGGPGTGKTTIIKCICEIFRSQGLKIELATPTGRASKRLSETTGTDARTIHRLLGLDFSSGRLFFNYGENNPLSADVIIVDEVSMADCMIFNALVKAMKRGCRLVLVGDKDQLPSVGAGNVLADIIKSNLFEINYLTYIYRQNSDSLIVSNAHLINEGKMPVFNNKSCDFFFMQRESPEETAKCVVGLVKDRLPDFAKVSAQEIQILAPLKIGKAGVDALNLLLQDALNPGNKGRNEVRVGNAIFRLGDKVMQTQNDYELEWTRQSADGTVEYGQGVFNGEIGYITTISPSDALVEILYDDNKLVKYSQIDLSGIMLAYAVTVHKSQGSEFDVVVIPLSGGVASILTKNLLYTAVTRAKKTVVLVGAKKHIAMMVKNNYIILRNTLLSQFLADEEKKYKLLFTNENIDEN